MLESSRRNSRRTIYFFAGAGPTFLPALVINSSKRLRALVQASALSGTAQVPIPLHLFSPGAAPQPPWPLQAFNVRTHGPWPWRRRPCPHKRSPCPRPFPLQVFRPRQTCGSLKSGFTSSAANTSLDGSRAGDHSAERGERQSLKVTAIHSGWIHTSTFSRFQDEDFA